MKKTFFKGDNSSVNLKYLLTFQKGNPRPLLDNTDQEPLYDLSGLDLLLSPQRLELYDDNHEAFERYAYQAFKSIIDLCKLQLGLVGNGYDNGYELEGRC